MGAATSALKLLTSAAVPNGRSSSWCGNLVWRPATMATGLCHLNVIHSVSPSLQIQGFVYTPTLAGG